MNHFHLTTKILSATCLSLLLITSSYAATSKTTDSKAQVEVESDQGQGTSQEEIATIDVLNEICPKILGTNNNKNFSKGYANLITQMLPSIKNPVAAVQAMHTDPDYMKIYNNARVNTLKEKEDDNRDVCLEVLHYKAQ
ncbi:MAG: hypothetical protein KGO49_04430 [Gammaproteobacteria bacterium]|nr:hypothetical protein [Gammaproteobacteria bacterium]